MNAAHGVTGYPVIQLMTLCETGTRADRRGLRQHKHRRQARRPGRRHRPRGPGQPARAAPPRVCPRRVKSPLSRWSKHPPGKR
jgi:hypothetical protein